MKGFVAAAVGIFAFLNVFVYYCVMRVGGLEDRWMEEHFLDEERMQEAETKCDGKLDTFRSE